MVKGTDYTGKAYAFFNCNASVDRIWEVIPTIREFVRTPAKLELALFEDSENFNSFQKDPALRDLARKAASIGRQYILDAECPGKSNSETADELAGILNQAYKSPLYQDGEPFTGDIAYRHRGKYSFRD